MNPCDRTASNGDSLERAAARVFRTLSAACRGGGKSRTSVPSRTLAGCLPGQGRTGREGAGGL